MTILCTIDLETREVSIPSGQCIAAYDHNVDVIRFQAETIPGFSLDTSTIRIAAQGPNKARHDYAVDPSTVQIEEETGYITFDWPIPAGVTEMPIGAGFKYGDKGQLIFAVCAEIISGDTVSKAWHSDDGIITVVAHLEPESGGGEDPEEEATNAQKIAQLQTDVAVINTQVGALANGSPTPVATVAEMTDESAVYLYTGSETGYTAGNWYFWNGTAWTAGGTYGGAVTDTTLSISGAPADSKAAGDALGTALTRLGEDEAVIAVKADKTETVVATIVEPYYLSHRYLQTDGSGLPVGTASGNWNLYKLDVSDCDAVKITTYRSNTGSAKYNMWSFLSSGFADVTSSSESAETVVDVGEVFLPTADAIVRNVVVPDGAKTMYIVCFVAQVSGFEVIKYDYGRFDTVKNIPALEAGVSANADSISESNDEIEDIKVTLYHHDRETTTYSIGGINIHTGLDNRLQNHLRCVSKALKKGDRIVNADPETYDFNVHKYVSGTYQGYTFVSEESTYTIDEDANYRIMVDKRGDQIDVAFTTEERDEVAEIVYYETLQDNKINYPAINPHGSYGNVLSSNGDGSTTWVDPIGYSQEAISEAVSTWLDEHPEATVNIEDYSVPFSKLVKGTLGFVSPVMFGAAGDGRTDDSEAIQNTIEYAIENGIGIVDGFGKSYIVSGDVKGDSTVVGSNRGVCIHGNVIFQNFNLKLADDIAVGLASVLNAYNAAGEHLIIRNVNIDGNRTNQTSVPSGVGQDGGFHGIRIGFNADCGFVEISHCDIRECYTDGICIRPRAFNDMKISDCYVSRCGRNGITDNAKSSHLENCIIVDNGTRTAPRSGYHIEPDNSVDFGSKKLTNCIITDNHIADFKVYFNTKIYNIDAVELDSCTVGKFSWSNHGITDDCLHKNIRLNNCIVNSVYYNNGSDENGLNRFECFEITNSRVLGSVNIVGGIAYDSGLLRISADTVDDVISATKVSNIILNSNLFDDTSTDKSVNISSYDNAVFTGNISSKSEADTINADAVVVKSGNIFAE